MLFIFWIFSPTLSTFGVGIFNVNIVGTSGLSGDVILRSYLLLDVYTLKRLLWVESEVSVITSTVGDLANYLSSIRMKDWFCCVCFSIWSFVCSRAAAQDFDEKDLFGFVIRLFLLLCFGLYLLEAVYAFSYVGERVVVSVLVFLMSLCVFVVCVFFVVVVFGYFWQWLPSVHDFIALVLRLELGSSWSLVLMLVTVSVVELVSFPLN